MSISVSTVQDAFKLGHAFKPRKEDKYLHGSVCVVWCRVWVQGLEHVGRRKFSIETRRSVRFTLDEGM